jgi:hypothetical protein
MVQSVVKLTKFEFIYAEIFSVSSIDIEMGLIYIIHIRFEFFTAMTMKSGVI